MRGLSLKILVASLFLWGCSSPPPRPVDDSRWFKIRDPNDVLCVAVEEDSGDLDLELTGQWSVSVESAYSMRVRGMGTIRTRGHEFRWDGTRLVHVATSRPATPGHCVFIDHQGVLREQLPMK